MFEMTRARGSSYWTFERLRGMFTKIEPAIAWNGNSEARQGRLCLEPWGRYRFRVWRSPSHPPAQQFGGGDSWPASACARATASAVQNDRCLGQASIAPAWQAPLPGQEGPIQSRTH